MDVFNYSFWKLYIKTINELDPGLNLPELFILNLSKTLKFAATHLPQNDNENEVSAFQ